MYTKSNGNLALIADSLWLCFGVFTLIGFVLEGWNSMALLCSVHSLCLCLGLFTDFGFIFGVFTVFGFGLFTDFCFVL